MEVSADISKWTVQTLKTFLKSKGIPCSGYGKSQLKDMVLMALQQPHLVEDVLPLKEDDHTQRRSIKLSGTQVLLPDPRTLTEWQEDLSTMPYITQAHVLMYLVLKQGWPAERIQAYEKECGYQLYQERHIQHVQVKKLDYDVSCIKGTCVRQTNQNETPYQVWMFASSNGDIHAAGCQCIGDDGGCKHVFAFIFAVSDFVQRCGVQPGSAQRTCTDVTCTWDKPRRQNKCNFNLVTIASR
ncbi:uncharacterized protein LOC126990229 isoform X2 [Eriocheir sinensis]|uniref:uncharacterized protein LOC126990229 isoform X2 n=1 Tax=Eriocheir sinensis TaxID=95602 RepID=UPI0021C88180|nr:uncharacterized protein LOC126990229 isoform X2 [Eriocheir sinensis]